MNTTTILAALTGAAVLIAPGVALAQDPLSARDRPDRAPAAITPDETPPTAVQPEVADVAPFMLRAISVEGSSLSPEVLNTTFRPFVNHTIDARGLQFLQRALALSYAESDVALPLVRFDLARSQEGVVVVHVTEARVANVHVSGDVEGDMSLVASYAAELTAETPLSRRTAERYLSLMSDIPGVEVDITPGASPQPGAVRLGLDVTRTDWETTIGFNTSGSRTLGRNQIGLTVDRNALFRQGDRTRLTVQVPTDIERFQSVGLSHRQPLGFDGAAIEASIGYLRTRPENGLEGDAVTAGVNVSYPVIRGYRDNLVVAGGLDGLNSDNAVFGERFATERVRALRGSAAWSRARPEYSLSASLVLSQGLDSLGASTAIPEWTDLDFQKASVRLQAVRAFGQRWRVSATAAAQFSGDATPQSEQFVLGGEEFGRGFPTALLAGDSGWGAALEVAWRPGFVPTRFAGSELYVFGDGGGVEVNDRPLLPSGTAELGSAGLGVRMNFGDRATIEVEAAQGFEDPRPGDSQPWRIGVSGSARFKP